MGDRRFGRVGWRRLGGWGLGERIARCCDFRGRFPGYRGGRRIVGGARPGCRVPGGRVVASPVLRSRRRPLFEALFPQPLPGRLLSANRRSSDARLVVGRQSRCRLSMSQLTAGQTRVDPPRWVAHRPASSGSVHPWIPDPRRSDPRMRALQPHPRPALPRPAHPHPARPRACWHWALAGHRPGPRVARSLPRLQSAVLHQRVAAPPPTRRRFPRCSCLRSGRSPPARRKYATCTGISITGKLTSVTASAPHPGPASRVDGSRHSALSVVSGPGSAGVP